MSNPLARWRWIEACLRYAGAFGAYEKKVYSEYLNVSHATLTGDQKGFVDLANRRIGTPTLEVLKGKIAFAYGWDYLPESEILPQPDVRRWLSVFGEKAYCAFDNPARRDPPESILREIYAGITQKYPVAIEYVSRSSGRSIRTVSPHILVDVAERLHLRAFDHGKNDFRDFVLTRIRTAMPTAAVRYVEPSTDEDWNSRVALEMILRQAPAGGSDEFSRMDFGTDENGKRRLGRVPSAVARYLVDPEGPFEPPVRVRRVP